MMSAAPICKRREPRGFGRELAPRTATCRGSRRCADAPSRLRRYGKRSSDSPCNTSGLNVANRPLAATTARSSVRDHRTWRSAAHRGRRLRAAPRGSAAAADRLLAREVLEIDGGFGEQTSRPALGLRGSRARPNTVSPLAGSAGTGSVGLLATSGSAAWSVRSLLRGQPLRRWRDPESSSPAVPQAHGGIDHELSSQRTRSPLDTFNLRVRGAAAIVAQQILR